MRVAFADTIVFLPAQRRVAGWCVFLVYKAGSVTLDDCPAGWEVSVFCFLSFL